MRETFVRNERNKRDRPLVEETSKFIKKCICSNNWHVRKHFKQIARIQRCGCDGGRPWIRVMKATEYVENVLKELKRLKNQQAFAEQVCDRCFFLCSP
jgi:uncharacterized pyridoxamine 5'-phosphate oxidase family protein